MWFVWALVQFTLSEGLFRLSMSPFASHVVEPLEMLSDAIVWPAGPIYQHVESQRMQEALTAAQADPSLPADKAAQMADLVATSELDPDSDEYFALLWFLEELGHDPTVPTALEYAIYGGVCVAWGLLMGGFVATLIWRMGGKTPQMEVGF